MPDSPWLDEREQQAWRAFLRLHAQVSSRLQRQLQRDCGLSLGDYGVLVNLSEAPDGRMRAFQLADALQWEKSRLSHQLRRMQARGLVDREGCQSDRRGAFVVITEAGRRAIDAAAPGHVAEVRRAFLDALSPADLDALTQMADAANRIAADGGAG